MFNDSPEILHNIFDIYRVEAMDVAHMDKRSIANRTLLALALTCHTFQDLALDSLWYTQISIVPLVQCLSDSTECVDDDGRNDQATSKRIKIKSHLTPYDISRLSKYAPRIRSLRQANQGLRPYPDIVVDGPVFEMLADIQSPDSEPLVPNLRILQWPVFGVLDDCVDFAVLFISPKLVDLDLLVADPTSNSIPRTLEKFAKLPPPVKFLGFQTHSFDNDATPETIISILSTLKTLTRIELEYPCWYLKEWKPLGLLPHLEALWICVPIELETMGSPPPTPPCLPITSTPRTPPPSMKPFPSLRELTLQFQHGGILFVNFLDHFWDNCTPLLTSLSLMYESPEDRVDTILLNIHRICNPQTLTTLKITHWGASFDEISGNDIDIATTTLAPLYEYSNLQTLIIQPMKHTDLDDPALERMARAWPKLEILDIGDQWVPESKVTLAGLIPLARYCRHLRSLSIVLQARDPISEDVTKEVEGARWESALTVLNVMESPIFDSSMVDEIGTIASYLRTIFPEIKEIRSGGGDQKFAAAWKSVSSKLQGGKSSEQQDGGQSFRSAGLTEEEPQTPVLST